MEGMSERAYPARLAAGDAAGRRSDGVGMSRCAPLAVVARLGRAWAVPHRTHAVPARHHGRAVTEPPGTADHLVDVALGSPATCALRALSRIAPGLPLDDLALLTAAAHVGMAFRTLFNQPETQALQRADGDVYWRAVLRYAPEHDLQLVLDEYVHVLFEAEGQIGHPPVSAVRVVAERMAEALSLRPAQIELNHYAVRRSRILQTHPITLRGRFAMRLAQKGEHETGVARTGLVRTAFNSPFRPFVLASTSVGQEGLDFHPYCHRIVHWNLCGAMRQRRLTRSISLNSPSVRMAANCSG